MKKAFRILGSVSATLLLVSLVLLASSAGASTQVPSSTILTSGPAQAILPPNGGATATEVHPARQFLRPTMPMEQYLAAKQAAEMGPLGVKSAEGGGIGILTTATKWFEGASMSQSADRGYMWLPSDVNMAVNKTYAVEVTNCAVSVFTKSTNAMTKRTPLSTFVGDTSRAYVDPRVIWDPLWNRFVIVCIARDRPDANTHTMAIAVSTSSNPTGTWWIYRIDVAFYSGDFLDYPEVGLSQDAVIITGNNFNDAAGYNGARLFAVAKARLYNGLGWSVPVFTGLGGTLTPPLVQDQDSDAWLMFNQPGTANIGLYRLRDAAYPSSVALNGPYNVATTGVYNVPPSAPQPGTTARIDTLDGRFVNYSSQFDGILYNAHTINYNGYATPKVYRIDTNTLTVTDQKLWFLSSTSHDFNVAVAAIRGGPLAVVWNSTDPPKPQNVRVNIAGGGSIAALPGTILGVGPVSTTFYADWRWGDMASIQADPSAPNTFWGAQQFTKATNRWGTKIFKMTVP